MVIHRFVSGHFLYGLFLRYFTEFGKPEFQLITAFARIELIDQQSRLL